MIKGKCGCDECGWRGYKSGVDFVADPRPLPGFEGEGWSICPRCRAADKIRVVCDEPGCREFVTCGVPTPAGYRNVCSNHYRTVLSARPAEEKP